MYYPEPNRAGSHGTSGVGVVIVLRDRYVSLITCCSADDNAVGARVVLRGPRGVSHITRVGVDKVGFNRLLVPYQHPLSSANHLFLLSLNQLCLTPSTPTLFRSIPSVMVLGSLPPPRRGSTFNDLSRRGAQGLPLIHLLSTCTRGLNVAPLRVIRLRISSFMTLWKPTKGGCHV